MVVSTGKLLTMNILVDFITLDDDNQIFTPRQTGLPDYSNCHDHTNP
jgi:hypothetical protein